MKLNVPGLGFLISLFLALSPFLREVAAFEPPPGGRPALEEAKAWAAAAGGASRMSPLPEPPSLGLPRDAGSGKRGEPDARMGARPVLRLAPEVRELSGMVLDARRVIWSHGDSGTGSWIGVTRLDTGITRPVRVRGASQRDWEAMALSPRGELWVLDTGDNWRWRPFVRAYSLGVPDPEAAFVDVQRSVEFTYPDGPQNVEAGFIEGTRLYLVQRREGGGSSNIYRIDVSAAAPARQQAELVGEVTGVEGPVTDASLSPSGTLYLLTYRGVFRAARWRTATPAPGVRVLGGWPWGQTESLIALSDTEFLIGREDGPLFLKKQEGVRPLVNLIN